MGELASWTVPTHPRNGLYSLPHAQVQTLQLLIGKIRFYTHPIVNGIEQPSSHLILPEKTKDFFRLRTFCCYEYSDLPESVEENMFQLVQRGMPLTPAEKMRALSTKWAVFAKQYEEDYAMVVNCKCKDIENDTWETYTNAALVSKQGRASGFRSVMTVFCQILEVMHPSGNKRTNREGVGQTPTLQASPQVLTRLLLDDKSLSEAVKAKFKEVFDKFQELVDLSSQPSYATKFGYKIIPNSAFDPAPDYLRERDVGHVKTFSPLELLATAILLLVRSDLRSTGMLIGDIKEMRIYLRRAHKDLRLNPACWATAWQFIDMDLISLRGGRGATRRNGVAVIADEEEDDDNEQTQDPLVADPAAPATPQQRARASTSGKRTSKPRLSRTDSSRAGIQPLTPDRGVTTTKNKDRLRYDGVNGGPVGDLRSAIVPHLVGSQAIVGSEASGFEYFSSGTTPNATGTPKSRALQITTFSDESDDSNTASANKKRKNC